MTYNFDTLYSDYVTLRQSNGLTTVPTIKDYIEDCYAMFDDRMDDGLEVEGKYLFVIDFHESRYQTDPTWYETYQLG